MADEAIYKCKGVLYNLPVERLRLLIKALQLNVPDLREKSRNELFVILEDCIADAIKEEDKGRAVGSRILEEASRFQDEVSQSTVPPQKDDQATVGPYGQAWRRGFKIVGGHILEKGTGLSFTSLQRQITAGLEKGYTKREVIDGVIRVVEHTSSLRHYLDGRGDMTLANLQCILRSH
ncbi:uncharacterized protein LOC124273822 [Haliotis rubra]|uniref:uncharacterized protein LOC124273822 n=1 Tax=Haliotis rubra TaxID=36100 RepID=UPI001EE5B885|nr:uncharacterized protein LOC124273822 [Haliotis rubra]